MGRYVKIGEKEQIPKNSMRVFTAKGRKILVANVERKFYAVSNKCPHLSYPLYLGSLDGKIITWGFHYAKFDVTTGKVLSPPAQKPLKTYNVRVEGSSVLVKLE
jgi:3-phenylpropionate/trans-cinnamate dioxygenase ferredoxin subunit